MAVGINAVVRGLHEMGVNAAPDVASGLGRSYGDDAGQIVDLAHTIQTKFQPISAGDAVNAADRFGQLEDGPARVAHAAQWEQLAEKLHTGIDSQGALNTTLTLAARTESLPFTRAIALSNHVADDALNEYRVHGTNFATALDQASTILPTPDPSDLV